MIQDPNANNGQQSAQQRAGTADASSGQQSQQQQQQQQRRSNGLLDLPSSRRRLMARTGHSGAVKAFAQAIRDMLEEDQLTQVKVHVLDHEARMTSLSAVILSLAEMKGTQRYISTYTLIIEDSGPSLGTRRVDIPGAAPIELPTVAGEVFNNNLRNKVQALVMDAYGNQGTYIDGGGTVLYRELSPTDTNRLHGVLYNGLESLQTMLQAALKTLSPLRVSELGMDSARFTAKVNFNTQELVDLQGMPVRSDFSIETTGQVLGKVDDMLNGVKRMCTINGYVEPTYFRPQNMMPAYPGGPLPTQHFYARLVLTNVETDGIPDMGIGQMLLAISTAELVSRRFLWAGVYRPSHKRGFNPRNIGALALDVPALLEDPTQPDIIDTSAPDFVADDLFKLISHIFYQEVIYSIDIAEAGPDSWLSLIFAAAAAGDRNACDRILNAADELTNGHFRNHWRAGEQIIRDDVNRIHLGYWTNNDGVKEDIRKLDYLAALNIMGKTQLDVCHKLANTYDRTDIPWEVRLHDREEIIRGMAPGEVTIKGYAGRYSFSAAFMMALVNGLRDAGFAVLPHNATYMGFADAVVRGNDNLNGLLFNGHASNGYFNYSQPHSNVNSGFRRGGDFWTSF